MKGHSCFKTGCLAVSFILVVSCSSHKPPSNYFQGVTIAPSYSYYLSGRTDRVTGFVIAVDEPGAIGSPGLVFLASGIDYPGEAYLILNDARYEVPALAGSGTASAGTTSGARRASMKSHSIGRKAVTVLR
jgi:hypothetical protein